MEKRDYQDLANILSNGLHRLEIRSNSEIQDKLISFIYILEKWNQVYNLTAIRKLEKMVTHHLLDSLSVLPYIKGPKIVDIGAGAGLPGIPIAILLPEDEFTLVDSNAKKTRFMQQVVSELKLINVSVLHSRVEDLPSNCRYDTVISRAFAAVNDMLRAAGHLCHQDGKILSMKGIEPIEEIMDHQVLDEHLRGILHVHRSGSRAAAMPSVCPPARLSDWSMRRCCSIPFIFIIIFIIGNSKLPIF